MYEDAIKCNEYIPFNETAYYDDEGALEEWAETTNNVTCAFIEAVQKGLVDEDGVVTEEASNSYSMSFHATMSSQANVSGGQFFFVAGAAVAFVGAALFVVRRKMRSKLANQDLNTAFVSMEGSAKA